MLKEGYYITENLNEPIPTNEYCLVVYLKETEKTIKMEKLRMFGYFDGGMDSLFKKDVVTIKKNKSPHTRIMWDDSSFTLYPYQSGVPFYFRKLDDRCYNITFSVFISNTKTEDFLEYANTKGYTINSISRGIYKSPYTDRVVDEIKFEANLKTKPQELEKYIRSLDRAGYVKEWNNCLSVHSLNF